VAGGFEFPAQVREIVDFAVVDHRQPAVGGRHRLASTVDVDHGQSRVTEQGVAVDQHFAGVGATRFQRRQRRVEVGAEGVADREQDAAHQSISPARVSQASSARAAL
jgi:hypothetical protein